MDPQNPNTPTPTTEGAQPPIPATPPPAPAAGTESPKKGYAKRPMWQWVALYLVIGAVVYAIVWYLFIKGDSASGLGY